MILFEKKKSDYRHSGKTKLSSLDKKEKKTKYSEYFVEEDFSPTCTIADLLEAKKINNKGKL